MSECLFCRIVAKDIPADVVLDRADVVAFRDINPQAPTHVLVVPKQHIPSLDAVTAEHADLLAGLVAAVADVARGAGLTGGFRVVANTGPDAGQAVEHLHLHVLGGRRLGWPPG